MMGIWIRSQNKINLVYADMLNVTKKSNSTAIKAKASNDNVFAVVGTYDSLTQAIQVLDMIQEFIDANGGITVGIWIRAQSKETLVNANFINICNDTRIHGDTNLTSNTDDLGFLLGIYTTEAEALRVLDMIQERIDLARPEFILMQGRAFQMPPAGFSEGKGEQHDRP